jgi:hypothetical protein
MKNLVNDLIASLLGKEAELEDNVCRLFGLIEKIICLR